MYTSALSVSENVLVNFAQLFSSLELHIKHSRLVSPETQPDEIKTYPVRPDLGDHRVFIPAFLSSPTTPSTTAHPQRLPLVISVHGSAWILGNPSDDDALNRAVADRAHVVVVAINYSKAPQHPFPTALEDVVALIGAVIDDPWLPIDRERVVLCGGSAGANLLLGAALDTGVRARNVRGIVAICPPVDMVTSKEDKMARRRRQHVPDLLEPFYDTIRATYLDAAKDAQPMDDLRLSPTFFRSRSDYPDNMYLIGFEDDLLCAEAEEMAEKLAGKHNEKTHTDRGWMAGGVTWEMVPEQAHGFAPPTGESAESKEHRMAEIEGLYDRIAVWVTQLFPEKPIHKLPARTQYI